MACVSDPKDHPLEDLQDGDLIQNSENLLSIIEEQRKSLYQLKTVINELPASVYWKDAEGVYLGHNTFSADKMRSLNFPVGSIVGKTDHDLFEKSVADQYREHDLRAMRTNEVSTDEEKITLDNGEFLIQLSHKKPLRDEKGKIVGVIGNTVDITPLKKIEAELREAKDKAETLNQAKSDMIKHMEHDIRTPFNGILVLSDLLEIQETDPEKKALLHCIAQSANGLLDYCNGLLEFIKSEHAVFPIIEKKFDLQKMIENVIVIESVAAKNKKLDLFLEYAEDSPKILIGDPNRIQRILLNLMSNAIKFTEVGYVKVRVWLVKKIDPKHGIFGLSIEDTGVGISIEKQAHLYEHFSNINFGKILGHEGYGLGLPLVKALIKDLEGDIEVRSEPGKGSCFICTLPFGIPLIDQLMFKDE